MILPFHPRFRLVEPIVSRLRGSGWALGSGWRTRSETVGEPAGDGLEVSHAAGTGGLPSLGLLAPVDCGRVNSSSTQYLSISPENVHLRVLAAGYPQEEQVCFWMWRERRPIDNRVSPLPLCASGSPAIIHRQSSIFRSPFSTSEGLSTYRNACTACASCCGACRSWKFP